MKSAGAILANASRNASPAAKRKNPKLKKVMGGNTVLAPGSMKAQSFGNRAAILKEKAAWSER